MMLIAILKEEALQNQCINWISCNQNIKLVVCFENIALLTKRNTMTIQDKIPKEILVLILKKLDYQSLTSAKKVCVKWRELIHGFDRFNLGNDQPRICVFGGWNGFSQENTIEIFDKESLKWELLETLK